MRFRDIVYITTAICVSMLLFTSYVAVGMCGADKIGVVALGKGIYCVDAVKYGAAR